MPLSLPLFGLGWFYNLGKSVAASFRDDDNVFNAVIVAHLAAAAAVVAREWRRKRERERDAGGRTDGFLGLKSDLTLFIRGDVGWFSL